MSVGPSECNRIKVMAHADTAMNIILFVGQYETYFSSVPLHRIASYHFLGRILRGAIQVYHGALVLTNDG